MKLDIRVRAFVLALYLASMGFAAYGQQRKVVLRGKLFAAPDVACGFFLDPTADSVGIQLLQFTDGDYLCDYFHGSETHAFTVTLSPE